MLSNTIKRAEEGKIKIRNVRRDSNAKLKTAETSKDITKDELKNYGEDIQTSTDKFVKQLDEIFITKKKDILSV